MGTLLMVLCLYLLNPLKAFSYVDTSSWLNIDCGASTLGFHGDLTWWPDENCVWTGMNADVSQSHPLEVMNTLRSFPVGKRNCYTFPRRTEDKVLLRAGFYYGNYDSLSKPPAFDLLFDGFLWATVRTTTGEEPIYHEVVYTPKRKSISICLVNTGNGVPFISSLEVTPWPANLYRLMTGNLGFYLRSRVNFGADSDIRYGVLSGENYNREWKAEGMDNYPNVSNYWMTRVKAENDPPPEVLDTAIEAPDASGSISFLLDLPRASQTAYIILYFMELELFTDASDFRRLAIYIDGRRQSKTVELKGDTCQAVPFYPVAVTGPTNLTFSPVNGSTLPPMVNAMEVYTTIDLTRVPGRASRPCHDWPYFSVLLMAFLVAVIIFE